MAKISQGGRDIFGISIMLICVGAGVAGVWHMLPDWLVRPDQEVGRYEYDQASEIIDSGYSRGDCNALKMDLAKALADRKLTAKEAHDLDIKAQELSEKAMLIYNQNKVLEAVGQKPIKEEIDCLGGAGLFGY
jgi:hypothetical protein